MVTFYIVRHGNTEFNSKDRLQGAQIDAPLTDQGYEDAFFLAQKLKNIKFDAVFSSDLGRAFITAHIIADNLKLTDKIFRIKELREIDYGDLSGESRQGITDLPFKKDCKIKAPNGESYLDLQERVVKTILDLSNKNYKNVLIVSHRGCIRCLLAKIHNKDLNLFLDAKVSHRFIGKLEIENNKILHFEILNE